MRNIWKQCKIDLIDLWIEFGMTIARRLKASRATAVRHGKACSAK